VPAAAVHADSADIAGVAESLRKKAPLGGRQDEVPLAYSEGGRIHAPEKNVVDVISARVFAERIVGKRPLRRVQQIESMEKSALP
jgi:hypothetical protein